LWRTQLPNRETIDSDPTGSRRNRSISGTSRKRHPVAAAAIALASRDSVHVSSCFTEPEESTPSASLTSNDISNSPGDFGPHVINAFLISIRHEKMRLYHTMFEIKPDDRYTLTQGYWDLRIKRLLSRHEKPRRLPPLAMSRIQPEDLPGHSNESLVFTGPS